MRNNTRSMLLRRSIIGVVFLIIAAGGTFLYTQVNAQQPAPQQPIAFNHQVMVQMGIDCLFCHTDATRSPSAGMPSVEKCMGCHKVIDPTNPEIQKVAAYWQDQQPIPWVRINQLPRFVYFSHQVHVVAGGINCETCHGDVAHMTQTHAVVQMNMGWCLSCHEKQPNANQLTECITCHQ